MIITMRMIMIIIMLATVIMIMITAVVVIMVMSVIVVIVLVLSVVVPVVVVIVPMFMVTVVFTLAEGATIEAFNKADDLHLAFALVELGDKCLFERKISSKVDRSN